ncbi:hypothetical protein F4808DRAFT_459599 [Astrocystis sublimbata]|nr:hypothetical protein F4808DRAFT_459599 [Astrocystis sublimbata]
MTTPNWHGEGSLAPPLTYRTSTRSSQSGGQRTITIEPKPDYQLFYNTKRREMDIERLESHVQANNSLEPSSAHPMSRSTTSDSVPSPGTVYSHGGDENTLPPDQARESGRTRPPRGRRTGPLDSKTRLETAFKRRFKLICDFHRSKKTSCNCHDFSKLEEGYRLNNEGQRARPSPDPSETPYGDIGTFGAGGAVTAAITQYQNFDLFDLTDNSDYVLRPNLRPALEFNIQSEASVSAIVTAPHETRDYLALPPVRPTEFAIGSSMPYYGSRWVCEYQHSTEDTRSLASIGECTWTGTYEGLQEHFTAKHRPFDLGPNARRSICLRCDAASPRWDAERACKEPEKCHPNDWQKFLFGIPKTSSRTLPSRIAMSEASGSRSSWFSPSWNANTPPSCNTEHSYPPYSSYTGNTGYREHGAAGPDVSDKIGDNIDEVGDSDEDADGQREPQDGGSCRRDWAALVRRRCPTSWLISSIRDRWRKCTPCDPRLSLPSHSKSDRCLLFSLLGRLRLATSVLLTILLISNMKITMLAFSHGASLQIWLLALIIFEVLLARARSAVTASYTTDGFYALTLNA